MLCDEFIAYIPEVTKEEYSTGLGLDKNIINVNSMDDSKRLAAEISKVLESSNSDDKIRKCATNLIIESAEHLKERLTSYDKDTSIKR